MVEDSIQDISFSHLSNTLSVSTLKKIKKFNEIRGKKSDLPFWDVVVLSALDEAQKKGFEIQLREKIARNELPLSTEYVVLHDPSNGVKVGNGGGVISVIHDLAKIYQDKFNKLKVLILLSGGYSQRLPSASLLGKVFTTIPMGNPIYQILELKLMMYIDFPQRMKPGVFVSSADSIELYELEGNEWTFENSGVTSLAHPSPIEIGTTHGVYVLEENVLVSVNNHLKDEERNHRCSTYTGKCRRFLHKPSKTLMRSSGAVFIHNNEEHIYSDSAYYMDMPTAILLKNWYHQRGGLTCEVDAYGDFLQALGPEAAKDYCQNVENVSIALPELIKTREEIFQLLRNVQLNVLMLNNSKFYHIGTTKEYLMHFCNDPCFRHELGCSNRAMTKSHKLIKSLKDSSVLIHSVLQNVTGVSNNVIIEYSSLNFANDIGENSIISNCMFPSGIRVPANSFLHTVVIRDEGDPLYVTVAFGVDDNLKKCCSNKSKANDLIYAGLPLDEALEKMQIFYDPWPEDCKLLNLWHAKLFSAFYNPEDSLQNAASILDACRNNERYKSTCKKAVYSNGYSMADVLRLKELGKLLEMRNKLRQQIDSM